MNHNPFELLHSHLSRLEALIMEQISNIESAPAAAEVGGLALAQQITRLSKPRIYGLVSAREIPHYKRGNKLYFNRAELLAWVEAGKRNVHPNAR